MPLKNATHNAIKNSTKRGMIHTFIIWIALAMMIISALITHFVIMKNQPILDSLKVSAQSKQALIREVWGAVGKKESRADIAILISVLPTKNDKDISYIKKRYLRDFPNLTESSSVLDIAAAVDLESGISGEYIDKLYLEQASIQGEISEIESNNKRYAEIAFFLQTLSLVLIILRKEPNIH